MASITTWARLEPRTRTNDLDTALQARVHDPLWLLARQWQVGELRGEDAGSAARVEMEAEWARLSSFRPGGPENDAVPLPPGVPLEALVEREDGRDPSVDPAAAAELGMHFIRLLRDQGLANVAEVVRTRFRLAAGGADGVDGAAARTVSILAGRAPDGHAIGQAIAAAREDASTLLDDLGVTDEEAWWAAVDAWDAWRVTLYSRPGAGEAATWDGTRLEHRFAVSAHTSRSDLVLEAPEYHGGRLDWYDFVFDPSGQFPGDPAEDAQVRTIRRTVLPAQARYPGMPVDRWWEFEDARTDFGGLEAEPGDLARLLVGAYAAFYSNDWFLVPLELPAGSVSSIRRLMVRNTFGEATLVQSALPDSGFRLFRLDPLVAGGDVASALFLAPAVAAETEGAPVEEVRFFRDEMANLAWAVEHTVQDRVGRPMDRWEAWTRDTARAARPTAADEPLVYRLRREVPPHWFPLGPVQGDGPGDMRLRLLARPVPGGPDAVPAGAILADSANALIHEEEIPREGVRIRRAWQMARGTDGAAHVWLGRRKTAGRGEGHSGLVFDSIGIDREDDGPQEPVASVLTHAVPVA